MFDSSTSGSDLYLEKGDIALFEPPFLESGWTVLSLADGARGTKPKPALEPVIPFHEYVSPYEFHIHLLTSTELRTMDLKQIYVFTSQGGF